MISLVARCSSFLLAGSIVACTAAMAAVPEPAVAPTFSTLEIPGGVEALLRASDVEAEADPNLAMLSFVRVAHGIGARQSESALKYLDAITRLRVAASALGGSEVTARSPGPAARQWAAACGLTLSGGTAKEADGAQASTRRRALEASGLPVAEWVKTLNAGGSIRAEVSVEAVPLPLTDGAWTSAVIRRSTPRDELARAIFGDRRAALTYYGLMALDDETLAYLGGHLSLLSAIAEKSPGVFAEWGRSIHVRNGRVSLPGGDGSAGAWREIVGQDASDAEAFIRALLSRDAGRAAFFFDAVSHLDAARQAFALAWRSAGVERVERVRELYGAFARTGTVETGGDWPVVRHPFNPAAALREVAVEESGGMAAPASLRLWEAALGGNPQACAEAGSGGPAADAAWLVNRLEREPLETRGEWLGAVAFAQRVFASTPRAAWPAVCEAAAAFPHSDGLLLTLERIGLTDPADYLAVMMAASRSWSGANRRAAVIRTAEAQAVLAILERAVSARTVAPGRARAIVLSLASVVAPASRVGSAAPAGDAAPQPGAVGKWIRETLLPDVCSDRPSADACLVRLVSGEPPTAGSGPVVAWEDDRYRVDLGAATAVRIGRIRQAQRATGIDEALNVAAAADILGNPGATADDSARAALILKTLQSALEWDLPELFGHRVPSMKATPESALASLALPAGGKERSDAAAELLQASDTLLADALVSFVYAMAIGDPDDAVLIGGNPARRHLFDGTLGPATPPWHVPEEVLALDKSWLVEGSVLLLRTTYARSWQRRISIQDPGARPRPDPQDVRGFGETAAVFNPFGLTDAGRDAIVAAIGRGRARVSELVSNPGSLWKVAVENGTGEWRCRAALLAARGAGGVRLPGSGGPERYFSLGELMRLGRPEITAVQLDAWGAATRMADGGAGTRMPRPFTWESFQGPRGVGVLPTQVADVHLRVAEALSQLKLPAALAPDVAAYAGWDVMTAARMAHPDDWFALARSAATLPQDRFLDYVSALTAIGPLVPAQ